MAALKIVPGASMPRPSGLSAVTQRRLTKMVQDPVELPGHALVLPARLAPQPLSPAHNPARREKASALHAYAGALERSAARSILWLIPK